MTLDELIAALQRIRGEGGEGAGKMPVAILGGEALLKIYSNGRLAALWPLWVFVPVVAWAINLGEWSRQRHDDRRSAEEKK